MPISKDQIALNEETINKAAARVKEVVKPIRIRPDRMEAFQAGIRLRTNLQLNGVLVQLLEDEEAPASFDEALQEACTPDAPPPLAEGGPCGKCSGRTVKMEDGNETCVKCGTVKVNNPEKSKVILASERAALRKSPRRH